MADKGILFSAPMVRALLEGRKTQTRRLLSSARVFATPEQPAFSIKGPDLARALQGASDFRHLHGDGWFWEADAFEWQAPSTRTGWMAHIGYTPGDRLYVREAFSYDTLDVDRDGTLPPWYWADGNIADTDQGSGNFTKPKPSIHMPRWASRLTLTVTDVRVQRLQEISEADAKAEGIIEYEPTDEDPAEFSCRDGGDIWNNAKSAFAALWDTLHTKPGERWGDNPFVIALSFDVRKGNIDDVAAGEGGE